MSYRSISGSGTSIGDLYWRISGVGSDIVNAENRPVLGGGLKGIMPRAVGDNNNDAEFATNRFTLRDAWNTSYVRQLGEKKRIITPFRAVYNAGDLLSRQNYSCGGSCQTYQSRPGLKGLGFRFGSIQGACDDSGVQASACNTKFVYDGSDYTTYLKLRAINKSYNKRAFGGDDFSSNQSIIKAIRRR